MKVRCFVAILIMVALQMSFVVSMQADDKKLANPESRPAPIKIFSNNDVIELVKSGFGDPVILAKIKQEKCKFDLSTDQLKALKTAGVSDTVISEMMQTHPFEINWPPKIFVKDENEGRIVSGGGKGADSSDIRLEAIKTFTENKWPVTMDPKEADLFVSVTRQMGKKSWGKDTKFTLTNRKGDVLHSESTRSVGGAVSNMIDFVKKHREDETLFQ